MIRLLKRIVIGILVLIIVLFLGRNFFARKAIEVGVKQVTGFPLEIGAVNIGVFGGVLEVNDLKLMNPPEFKDPRFVNLPQFKVDYVTFSMLRGAPHIKELVVNVSEVVVVKNEKGQSNATLIQEKVTPAASPTGAEKKPASESKLTYRVDLIRVHIGTVVIKDYSKAQPTEKTMTLNRDVVLRDITDANSISALVMRTILGPVGDVAGELVKGVSGAAKDVGQNLQKTSKGLLDGLKKAVPTK